MVCILCGNETRVINSRSRRLSTWRRRRCQACHHIATTYERYAEQSLPVVTIGPLGGPPHPLSTVRLTVSISKLISGLPSQDTSKHPADIAHALATTIVERLIKMTQQESKKGLGPITPQIIARTAYVVLKAYEPALGIRYGLEYGVVAPTQRSRRSLPRV